jgi:hypothetical protein
MVGFGDTDIGSRGRDVWIAGLAGFVLVTAHPVTLILEQIQ